MDQPQPPDGGVTSRGALARPDATPSPAGSGVAWTGACHSRAAVLGRPVVGRLLARPILAAAFRAATGAPLTGAAFRAGVRAPVPAVAARRVR